MVSFLIKVVTGLVIFAAILFEWRNGFFRETGKQRLVLDGKTQVALLGLFLSAIGLLFVDPVVIGLIQSIEGVWFDVVLGFGRWIGRHILKLLILCYIVSLILKRTDLRRIVFGSLVGGAVTGIFNSVFKMAFMRARPDSDLGPYSFFNYREYLTGDRRILFSFPSGDVAVVAGVTCYLFCVFKDRVWRWFLLLIPLTTACYRMDMNRHWPSDTVAAIAVGLAVGKLLFSVVGEEKRALPA